MPGKKVLIVEDNDLNMKLVFAMLELSNVDAICAEDAETGLDPAHEHRPDLILMDIRLPGMVGLTATRRIQALPDLNDIPAIALTGYALDEEWENSFSAGCIGCIAKPIDTLGFMEKMQKLLGHASE